MDATEHRGGEHGNSAARVARISEPVTVDVGLIAVAVTVTVVDSVVQAVAVAVFAGVAKTIAVVVQLYVVIIEHRVVDAHAIVEVVGNAVTVSVSKIPAPR
jgi:hypothetical protein